ncbi:hypothetical protein L9F63_019630, partial [Diploptera punctata]
PDHFRFEGLDLRFGRLEVCPIESFDLDGGIQGNEESLILMGRLIHSHANKKKGDSRRRALDSNPQEPEI